MPVVEEHEVARLAPGRRVHVEASAQRPIGSVDENPRRAVRFPRRRGRAHELARGAQLLVTMGCGEACPNVPGLARADWPLSDPKGQPLERVREIRDEVRARIETLIEQRGWGRDAGARERVAR